MLMWSLLTSSCVLPRKNAFACLRLSHTSVFRHPVLRPQRLRPVWARQGMSIICHFGAPWTANLHLSRLMSAVRVHHGMVCNHDGGPKRHGARRNHARSMRFRGAAK